MRTRPFVMPVKHAFVGAILAVATLGVASSARAQGAPTCNPQCAQGQICVQGTCMIPAPQAAPPPPVANPQPNYYPPPPQGGAYPPPQGGAYPPPQGGAYPPPQGGAYPPPQGGAYPPPQGGAYPPPQGGAYPPPQAYAYPTPPPAAPVRRGFLALPFLGLNSYQGKTGDNLGVGLRLGTLLGGRVSEMVSVNGEITLDIVNPENVPSGTDVMFAEFLLALSPLVHVPAGTAEFVVGPKLGIWAQSVQVTNAGLTDKFTASGYVFGLNAGIFSAVSSSMSVGGLLSFDVRTFHEVCSTLSGFSESCTTDSSLTGPAEKVLGFNAALLF